MSLMMPREDRWGLMELQNCILNTAKYLHDLCENNGISYCLMGGSALGAVRHNGFIPWDDDLDVFMTPDDYDKFRDVFLKKGDRDRYYLQEKGADGFVSTAKLRYNWSMYLEDSYKDMDINQGVFVDIFILHTCPNNRIKRYWLYLWSKYIILKGLADRGSYPKKGGTGIALNIVAALPPKFAVGYALKQVYRYRNDRTEYLCHFLGHARLNRGIYKRDYFSSVKKHKFEETQLYVPIKVEEYLRDRWGDYMQLPSDKEIQKGQHSCKWSVTEPFPGYNREGFYKDEEWLLP